MNQNDLAENEGLQIFVKMDFNEVLMVLKTKWKDLGRSKLSLSFGSLLNLAKLVFLTIFSSFDEDIEML
jgi:hypothetical protein